MSKQPQEYLRMSLLVVVTILLVLQDHVPQWEPVFIGMYVLWVVLEIALFFSN